MVVFPNAKINIGLYVTEKRPDSYHNLLSGFYPVPWLDILEIIEAANFSFATSGIPIPGHAEENLCVKAYQLLQKDFGLPPVQMYLHKQIPIGSGLGGGSADASFTLKCLNQLFQLNLDKEELLTYAAQLGSDCPFFIENKPVLATGRGDVFRDIKLDLSGKFLVLVAPQVHFATAEAFTGIQPNLPAIQLQTVLEQESPAQWAQQVKNDFETSVFSKYPQIAKIKDILYQKGALYSSMTGSGASVFGIFEKENDLKTAFPDDYTLWQGKL